VLCIDTLGADASVFDDYRAVVSEALTEEQLAQIAELEERRRRGEVAEAELVARFALVWPLYFAGGKALLPPPVRAGVQASIETNRSLSDHFGQATLARRLPAARLPAL